MIEERIEQLEQRIRDLEYLLEEAQIIEQVGNGRRAYWILKNPPYNTTTKE
jgi:hypothetical protein